MRLDVYHQHLARLIVIAATIVLMLGANLCRADTLVLNNGRRIEGRLISEDDQRVSFEIQSVGVRMTIRRPASEVKQVIRETQEGPTYCVLPIVGPIGRDLAADSYVTADAFIQALDEVKTAKPDYVILDIKSPGGDIAEMDRIVAAIAEARGLKFIAHVQEAHSAAAVIAMTCPTIFMAPDSSIGAAVPFSVGPEGTPQNIQEKWLSAIRAGFRNAAEIGGHSPLILRGMSETEIELAVINRDGQPIVIEPAANSTGRIIKHKGQILTLTANEALACGLSEATVGFYDEICEHLGLESWHPTLSHTRNYIIDKSRSEKRQIAVARERAVRLLRRAAERQAQIDRISPELSLIETRLVELDAQAQAASVAEQELLIQQDQQLIALEAEYQHLWDKTEYRRQRSIIIGEFQRQITEVRERRNKAVLEADELRRRQRELINSVPR